MGDVNQHSCYLLLPSSLSQDLMTSINSRSITLYLQVGKVGWGQPAAVLVQHDFANLSGLLVGAAERLRSAGRPGRDSMWGLQWSLLTLQLRVPRENVREAAVEAARLLMTWTQSPEMPGSPQSIGQTSYSFSPGSKGGKLDSPSQWKEQRRTRVTSKGPASHPGCPGFEDCVEKRRH